LAFSDPREALPRALDALSQLLEAATSAKASPVSDAFVFEGLRLIGSRIDELINASVDMDGWLDLQFAAYFSGIGIAHAGLGLVHGIAGNLGAAYPIAHGIACGILLAPAFRVTLNALLRDMESEEHKKRALEGLKRLARAGDLLSGKDHRIPGPIEKIDLPLITSNAEQLINRLDQIRIASGLGNLSQYGIDASAIQSIANTSSGRDSLACIQRSDISATIKDNL
jgi:alcohol dehydrogenase